MGKPRQWKKSRRPLLAPGQRLAAGDRVADQEDPGLTGTIIDWEEGLAVVWDRQRRDAVTRELLPRAPTKITSEGRYVDGHPDRASARVVLFDRPEHPRASAEKALLKLNA